MTQIYKTLTDVPIPEAKDIIPANTYIYIVEDNIVEIKKPATPHDSDSFSFALHCAAGRGFLGGADTQIKQVPPPEIQKIEQEKKEMEKMKEKVEEYEQDQKLRKEILSLIKADGLKAKPLFKNVTETKALAEHLKKAIDLDSLQEMTKHLNKLTQTFKNFIKEN